MIEIDLHDMNYDTALKIFIQKYNSLLKNGFTGEICIIHGYGSGFLNGSSIIRDKIRAYFSKNREYLQYRLTLNPGVTFVKPLKPLPIKNIKKKKMIKNKI